MKIINENEGGDEVPSVAEEESSHAIYEEEIYHNFA